MGNKIIKVAFIILSFVLLDVFARFLFAQNWLNDFHLSKEVDPISVLSVLLTSIVTLVAAWYISKKIKEQRFEKDFLLKDLSKIEQTVEEIENLISPGSVELKLIIEKLSNIQRLNKSFSNTLKLCGKNESRAYDLNSKYSSMYSLLTDCDSNHLIINDENDNKLLNEINSYSLEIRRLILKVNKL